MRTGALGAHSMRKIPSCDAGGWEGRGDLLQCVAAMVRSRNRAIRLGSKDLHLPLLVNWHALICPIWVTSVRTLTSPPPILQVGRRFIAMCEQLAGGPIAAMLQAGLLRRLRESITEHLLCRLCARTDPELLELLSGTCGRQGYGIQNLLP